MLKGVQEHGGFYLRKLMRKMLRFPEVVWVKLQVLETSCREAHPARITWVSLSLFAGLGKKPKVVTLVEPCVSPKPHCEFIPPTRLCSVRTGMSKRFRQQGQLLRSICGFSDSGTLFVALCRKQSSPLLMECGGEVGSLENMRQTGGACTQRLWWGRAQQQGAVNVQNSPWTVTLRL